MKNLLLIVIVGSLCFVGTASDITDTTTYDYEVTNWGLLIEVPPEPCSHDKLKAVEDSVWGVDIQADPRMVMHRMYRCKKCKALVLIQQAVEVAEQKECEKAHLEDLMWDSGAITVPLNTFIE